jgi:hypothetical protein
MTSGRREAALGRVSWKACADCGEAFSQADTFRESWRALRTPQTLRYSALPDQSQTWGDGIRDRVSGFHFFS